MDDVCLPASTQRSLSTQAGRTYRCFQPKEVITQAIEEFRTPVILRRSSRTGQTTIQLQQATSASVDSLQGYSGPIYRDMVGILPSLYPEWLGDQAFCQIHGCRFPYVVGEMAQGIASTDVVIAGANTGFLAFFGSAGLPLDEVEQSISKIQYTLGQERNCWGANLIHQPSDQAAEDSTVELFLRLNVRRVSASAFASLSASLVWFSAKGLYRANNGEVCRTNYLFPKVSRPEVGVHFMRPAPADILRQLVATGKLSPDEAELAQTVPVADDITVEADSGGHTDNRQMSTLFPMMAELARQTAQAYRYDAPIRLGLGGGIGTPSALCSAFDLGASYAVTGSINQSAVEAGISDVARQMLCNAELTDTVMAPAADMFEMGVKVQVLKRGTMFAMRAQRLFEIYRKYGSLEDIPLRDREWIEKSVFRETIDDAWSATRSYLATRDGAQAGAQEVDPKQRMALVFRRYLFFASEWARQGRVDRQIDFQIWCGPAMGAFNDWVKGSFLEQPEDRSIAQIGLNLLEGAATLTRVHQLRCAGVPIPAEAYQFKPRQLKLE